MNKRGMVIEIIACSFIFVLIFAFTLLRIPIEDNTGSQTGYITTIETNGVMFKTTSVYIKSKLESSQEERYCVEEDEAKIQLTKAMESEQKVKIYFNDVFSRGLGRCKESDLDVIYKVEVLDGKEGV